MDPQTGQPDGMESDWRELYRCDDRDRAVSVATTIAAMGFDVECGGTGGAASPKPACASGCGCGVQRLELGDPPYVIRVPAAHVSELGPIVHEILAEQAEFDRTLAQRDEHGARLRQRFIVIALIAAMLLLGLLGLLRM